MNAPTSALSRRNFLRTASLAGASTLALGALTPASLAESMKDEHSPVKKGDIDILIAAQIAEALAVTT
ncbi:MAG TPA: twin-arginine translocation signal domain-containing protein, partial [Acidobacteriaceae bacterium]